MATQKNGEYWKKRYEYLENVQNKKSVDICKDIEKIYKRAISDCESEIAKWYTRIGDNNGISYSEAKKLLDKNELEEFRWSVEEYIQHGKENAVSKAWTKQLENASAKVHISRLEAMKLQMRHQVELAMAGEAASVEKFIKDVYTDSYYRSVFEMQKGLGIGTAFNILDAETVDKIIHKPWAADGLDFSKRIWGKHRPELINRLQTELSHAFIRGDNPKTLIGKIKKEFGVTRGQAENLVLTEAAFFRASGQKKSFENLGVSQYEICATLDNRTSEICQDMDGKKFDVADMQIGVNHPPFHCRCRTTTVPVVEDEFLEGETRAARSVEGDYYRVPGDMKYSDWKQKYVDGSDNVKTAVKNTVKLIGGIIKAVDKMGDNQYNNIAKSISIIDFDNLKGNDCDVADECIDAISKALGDDGKYFDNVAVVNLPPNDDGTIDLLRTNAVQKANWADINLEINAEVFKGKTLEEINRRIQRNHKKGRVVITNLDEAVKHEIGHAKIIYGKQYPVIARITEELKKYKIIGISQTASINGDECIAECYVLKCRGEKLPEQAEELYNKYMEE